jgi:hypothetical protein
MRPIRVVLSLSLGLAVAACGSPTPPGTSTATSTTQTSAAPARCLPVSASFLSDLGVTAKASAVAEAVEKTATGLTRLGMIWFVSTRDGASWVTNADPTVAGSGGLTLPLNDKARAASDMGVDAQPGAPAYAGYNDASPGVRDSRTCAEKL